MKRAILAFVLFLSVVPCFSQSDSDMTNAVLNTSYQVAVLSSRIDSMNSTLATAIGRDSAGFLIVDSSALELAQSHPEILYTDMFVFSGRHTNSGWVWLRFISSLIVLGGMLYYGFKYSATSSLCRDEAYNTDGTLLDVMKRPFSYGRVQLFWWTMIILSCYTFFYGLTGTLAPLNPTAVILLGFGAIVLAGGKIIDKRQISGMPLGTRGQDSDASRHSFLTDIISDENGPSIHRFQAVIFNVVFGLGFISFFIHAIYNKLYPFVDFSEWQFALIGISSATYLGMKATENDPAVTSPPQSPPPPPPQDNGNNSQDNPPA